MSAGRPIPGQRGLREAEILYQQVPVQGDGRCRSLCRRDDDLCGGERQALRTGRLRQLRRSLRAPVILIWDGLTSHWSRKMTGFAASQKWLQIERLPGYAPDLNPCEGLWANLKGGELDNCAEETIAEVNRVARQAAQRAASSQQLLFGFLSQTGLSF